MARAALNKATLHREKAALERYRRYLPSLDLKRKQLVAELAAARRAVREAEESVAEVNAAIGRRLPMLALEEIEVAGLVRVTGVRLDEVNRLGVVMPVLAGVELEVRPYSRLAKPHWVDAMVRELRRMAELRLEARVAEERVRRLERGLAKVTQRVNLFDKVLVPRSERTIARIEIQLADAERAAVVRAKIAKAKHRARRGGLADAEDARP